MHHDRFSRGSPYPDIPSLDVVLLLEAFHPIVVACDVYGPAVTQQAVDHGGSDQLLKRLFKRGLR
jgi:hypothetical protein